MESQLTKQITNFSVRYWIPLTMVIWIGLSLLLGLVGFGPYGIEEGAARALILNWSVSDQIVSPIVIFGSPDLRALLFAPIGIYWSGSMVAAKIMSLGIAFLAVYLLYNWNRRENPEAALIASALVLISPFLFAQVDSFGVGVYLLLAFGMGAWLDKAYRKNSRYYGAWYFLQLIWITIVVTLHPMGLAYPLALALWWGFNRHESKTSRHVFIGIAIATLISIAFKTGWSDINWFANPIRALSAALQGSVIWSDSDINWIPGIVAAAGLLLVMALDRKALANDLLGMMLLGALLIGLLAADSAWATVALTLLIFRGIPILIKLNQARQKTGFLGQRGIVTAFSFIVCTFFMLQVKAHAYAIKYEVLGPEDELIQTLANIAQDESKPFRAASQWPGRTMLACKRDVLPLPPAFDSPEELQQKAIKSLTHLIFDPYLEKNKPLAANLSMLTGETETTAIMKAGALITVTSHDVRLHVRPEDSDDKPNKDEPQSHGADGTDSTQDIDR